MCSSDLLEDFAQLDGPPKAFQVRLEWFVDFDLPDGRADSAEPKAMFLQKRFELADLQIGQVQYVGFENRSKKLMANGRALRRSYGARIGSQHLLLGNRCG